MAKNELKLVTHPRSGTHWVLKIIFDNFVTPYKEYMEMFGDHKLNSEIRPKFPRATIIHCSRNIQSVLTSVFRMRERNGIKLDNFSDFIRMPYTKMPKIAGGNCKIFYDGKLVSQARQSWIQNQPLTPPELWLLANMFWLSYADLTITYEQMQQDQAIVLNKIEELVRWKRKPLRETSQIVGWHPPNNKPFEVSKEDQDFLNHYDKVLGHYRKRCFNGTV